MAGCMNEVRDILVSEGLPVPLPVDECNSVHGGLTADEPASTMPWVGVEFADDVAIMLALPARGMHAAMRRACHCLGCVRCRGPLAQRSRSYQNCSVDVHARDRFQTGKEGWGAPIGECCNVNLPYSGMSRHKVVHNYVHAGSVLDAPGAMVPESHDLSSTTTDALR
eukprot:7108340-Pyramimonas_sp.AAC.1